MYLQALFLVLSAPFALSQSMQIQIQDVGCVFVTDNVAGCTGTSEAFATPDGDDCSSKCRYSPAYIPIKHTTRFWNLHALNLRSIDITKYDPEICGWKGYDNLDPVAVILLQSGDYGDPYLVTFGNGDVGLECDLPNLSNGASCSPTPTPVTSLPATSTPSG
jgi:hypothetical protein